MWISRKKLKEKREHSYKVGYHDGIAHQYYKQKEIDGKEEESINREEDGLSESEVNFIKGRI